MTGKIISQYETLQHLEDNELGSVYEAQDLSTGRLLCLLLLPLHLPDESRDRALQDLSRLAKLEDPHLEIPLDFGETELGQVFAVFSYDPDTQTLQEELRRVAALPPTEACSITEQLALGLAPLHDIGLCHGFLRPGLIFRPEGGAVRIRFPGLGHAIPCPEVRDRFDQILAYRAPEQLRDQTTEISTDVWALGGIFYEMLTRRRPFSGISSSDLTAEIVERPMPKSWEGIPADSLFDEILHKTLSREPEARYESVRDLAAAVRQAGSQAGTVGGDSARGDGLSGDVAERSARSLAGRIFSHFEVIEKIGVGGMGEVFLAKDLRLDRKVALKFLSRRLDRSEKKVERFIQEAKSASALDHPNICTIHAIEETDDGAMFIAMAYYEGEMLNSKIEQGALPLQEIVEIGSQLCSGLAAAHERGIVHRDIKPANIMVTRDGVVKILDFGLSKYNESSTRSSASGPVMGTVDYMAPEQALGREVNHQADVWSLGVVLFEMATGQRPFRGSNQLSILFDIVHNDPRGDKEKETAVMGIPIGLGRVIRKALAKDLEDRYQNVLEVREDLEALREGRPVAASRQRGRRLGWAAAAAVLLIAVVVWMFWSPSDLDEPPEAANPKVQLLLVESGDSVESLFVEGLAQALKLSLEKNHIDVEILESGEVSPGEDSGEATEPEGGPEEESDPPEVRLRIGIESQLVDDRDQWRYFYQFDGDQPETTSDWFSAYGSPYFEEVGTLIEQLGAELEMPALLSEWGSSAGERDTTIGPVTLLPGMSEVHAALRQMDGQKALDLLEEAEQRHPNNLQVLQAKVEAFRLLGRKKDAAAAAEALIEESHKSALAFSEQLFIRGLAAEVDNRGDESKWESAAILMTLWQADRGYPFNDPDDLRRLDYTLHLAESLLRGGSPELAIAILRSLAEEFPDDSRIPLLLGLALQRLQGSPELALEASGLFEEAARLAAESGTRVIEGQAMMRRGIILENLRKFDDADEMLQRAEAAFHRAGDEFGLANIGALRGNMRLDQQRLAEARISWNEARDRFRDLGDDLMSARMTGNLALLLEEEGKLRGAMEMMDEAIELNMQYGDSGAQALNYANLARVLIALGKIDQAGTVLGKAEKLYKGQVEDIVGLVGSISGQYRMVTGDLRTARAKLDKALEVVKRDRDQRMISRVQILLAELAYLKGDLDEALIMVDESLIDYEKTGYLTIYSQRAHMIRGRIFHSRGEWQQAKEMFEEVYKTNPDRGIPISIVLAGEADLAIASVDFDLLRLGRPESSLEEIRALAEQGQNRLRDQGAVLAQLKANDLLAKIAWYSGQNGQARQYVEEGLGLLAEYDLPFHQRPLELTQIRIMASEDRGRAYEAAESFYSQVMVHGLFKELEMESRLLNAELRPSQDAGLQCENVQGVYQNALSGGFGRMAAFAKKAQNEFCSP